MTAPRYTLDTNIVFDFIRNPEGKAAHHIALIGDQGLPMSIITAADFGLARRRKAQPVSRRASKRR